MTKSRYKAKKSDTKVEVFCVEALVRIAKLLHCRSTKQRPSF